MKNVLRDIAAAILVFSSFCCRAQDAAHNIIPYDPQEHKVIPDKVFEIGIPALLLLVLLNTIITILKNRADSRLKLQMIERGVSEETLITIFRESNAIATLQPLKYALYGFSLALSLITIHVFRSYFIGQPGYLAAGIILLFTSVASYIYYLVLRRKL